MCGEKSAGKSLLPACFQTCSGSPPHVRGKDKCTGNGKAGKGITPACARKSYCYGVGCCFCRDHPRMCGEKHKVNPCKFQIMGSPPHVRGKVTARKISGIAVGITPACAGKSRRNQKKCSFWRDHPRMCGEKLLCLPILLYGWGSPPHVRGKDFESLENQALA